MSFDHRLRERFRDAERQMPHSSVDWATTIARGKRQRMYRSAMVAAAAVLFIGGGALSARGLMRSDPAPLPAPADTPDQEPTPRESPTEGVSEGADPESARPAVLDWIEALALGDAQGAWERMSPASQEYYGSIERFKSEFMGELMEGWGSWYSAAEPLQTDIRVLASSGEGAVGVVTVYGEVDKEGMTEFDADSVAFRILGGETLIEPYSSKIEIQALEPSLGQTYDASSLPSEVRAEVPSDVSQVNFFVAGVEGDGFAAVEKKDQKGSQPPNSIATAPFPEGLAAGAHFLTIAAVDAMGEVAVQVVPFSIE